MHDLDIYPTADFLMLTSLNESTARHWEKRGIIRASLGRGLYSFLDVYVGHLAASLRHAGKPLNTIAEAAKLVRDTEWDGNASILAIIGDDVSLTTAREVNRQLLRGVPVAHIDLIAAAENLRDEIDFQRKAVRQAETKVN